VTEAQAQQLEGRRSRFLVELASRPDEYEGQVSYDCAGPGLVVDELSNGSVRNGQWHNGTSGVKGQVCVDVIDVEVH